MPLTNTRVTLALLASTALAGSGSALAQVLPTGPSVAHGGVSVATPSTTRMDINQSSGTAIVNWQGFSIGQGAQVNINQPSAQSAILNRVTGQTPSTIAGQLNANGQVFLVNPNGIAITKSGVINTGSFVASTLGMKDDDFKAGNRSFAGTGNSAAVTNEGAIRVAPGGYAALLGGRVDNSGTITVPMGQVGLGAGEAARLDLSGDGFLQVSIPSQGQSPDRALVSNSGTIRARGGVVELKAASVRDAARNVVNVSGVVEARSVSGRSGAIVLSGGDGGVTVSGRLSTASAPARRRQAAAARPPTRGGDITVTGADIRLQGAKLDASGTGGGGQVRVGGDYKGGGTLQRAATTTVDAGTSIKADALNSGDGGRVIVWSDQTTSFAGTISAKGGSESGNGGFAEVSGKGLLDYKGQTDLRAPNGQFGTLLLDPYNVTISTGEDTHSTSAPGSRSFGPPLGTITGTQFTPTADDSVINANTLLNALASANVIVTTGTGGTQAGNISVLAPLSWTAPTNLGLDAAGAILVNASINATSGSLGLRSVTGIGVNAPLTFGAGGVGLVTGGNINIAANVTAPQGIFLSAGNPTGTGPLPAIGSITATGAISAGLFVLDRGNWAQTGANLPAFSARSFTVTTGTASFLRAQGGDGSAANPYLITDVYGLQGIGTNTTSAPLLSRNYALANNIDASGTANWNAGTNGAAAGFAPIGSTIGFTGSLDGRGFAVDRLTINRPTTNGVGLFGAMGGSVRNVQVSNAAITGQDSVGALAGEVSAGASVTGSSSSGTVTGGSYIGGLIGSNAGTIDGSRSSANASGSVNDVGGLVGENTGGIIRNSSASGAASGAAFHVGGLLGHNYSGTVTNSSATGSAESSNSSGGAGGLVGQNDDVVTLSYATGPARGLASVGGLIGINSGDVTQSYATGSATGTGGNSTDVGGLIGTSSGTVADTFATGAASGSSAVGGLVGRQSGGTIARSYAAGPVSGSTGTGGLVGSGTGGAGVSDSYFDRQTTGQTASAGGTSRSTEELVSGLPSGFSPAIWGSGSNGQRSYPFILALPVPSSAFPNVVPEGGAAAPGLDLALQQPTFSRQLTQTLVPVPANNTVIDINVGGGGPTLGVGDRGSTADGNSRQGARSALNFIQNSSAELERRLQQCESASARGGQSYSNCVGSALDQFADRLDTRILQLPAPLRNVTAVIREAARGVRAATNVAAARAVVRNAVSEVRKAIALIRADEPAVARLQVRQANAIAGALQSVETRLARAVGL